MCLGEQTVGRWRVPNTSTNPSGSFLNVIVSKCCRTNPALTSFRCCTSFRSNDDRLRSLTIWYAVGFVKALSSICSGMCLISFPLDTNCCRIWIIIPVKTVLIPHITLQYMYIRVVSSYPKWVHSAIHVSIAYPGRSTVLLHSVSFPP